MVIKARKLFEILDLKFKGNKLVFMYHRRNLKLSIIMQLFCYCMFLCLHFLRIIVL